MLEETLDFDGIDEICCAIEDLQDMQEIIELAVTFSISAPLK